MLKKLTYTYVKIEHVSFKKRHHQHRRRPSVRLYIDILIFAYTYTHFQVSFTPSPIFTHAIHLTTSTPSHHPPQRPQCTPTRSDSPTHLPTTHHHPLPLPPHPKHINTLQYVPV